MSDRGSPAPAPATDTLHDGVDNVPEESRKDLGDYDTARAGDSDRESDILSDVDEIDEDQFDEYDASAANIDERPVEIDEDVARTLKASKRKGTATKKPKEGKREKKRRDRTDDALDAGDAEIYSGKRVRKAAAAAAEPAEPEPENEEDLTPEERRRRAIERASRKEVKKPSQRRKRKDEEDLEDELDDIIASLKIRMERACEADNIARGEGQPAIHKLKLLPEVMALLNRNNNQAAVVDPDTNFLQHVKFFLEPLNDGSLPAYNIQRDIFTALVRLPIDKECLLSSGIGKVVLFYTKSKRPELLIKRMAEKLIGEWSRPILKRTHDYRKRHVESRDYDYQYVFLLSFFAQNHYLLSITQHTNHILSLLKQSRQAQASHAEQPVYAHAAARGPERARCRARAHAGARHHEQPRTRRRPTVIVHDRPAQHVRRQQGSGPPAHWCQRHGGLQEDDHLPQEEGVSRVSRFDGP